MCGIIGIVSKKQEFPVELFRQMLLQSQIRGQHATGISFIDDALCTTIKKPIPASEFELPEILKETKIAIGHTRYSTSDIDYNQPLSTGTKAIALNGVITQAAPEWWQDMFGVVCEGKNDAEIVLRTLVAKQRHPLLIEPSSQACVAIDSRAGTMEFWRNEERPLYYLDNSEYTIVASTLDIFCRVGLRDAIMCDPCFAYTVSRWGRNMGYKIEKIRHRPTHEDLQA